MDKDYAFSRNYNYRRLALVLSIRLITLIPREGTETFSPVAYVFGKHFVDYPYSPRGDGNSTAMLSWLSNFLLITLIPREGTET